MLFLEFIALPNTFKVDKHKNFETKSPRAHQNIGASIATNHISIISRNVTKFTEGVFYREIPKSKFLSSHIIGGYATEISLGVVSKNLRVPKAFWLNQGIKEKNKQAHMQH